MTYSKIQKLAHILTFTVIPLSSHSRESCNFGCKEIPDDHETLVTFGEALEPELPSQISLLDWNMYKSRKKDWETEFHQFTQGKDLILTQEYFDSVRVRSNHLQVGSLVWNFGISFFMKDDITTGVNTGSIATPTEVHYFRTKDLEPFVKSPKVSLVTKYKVAGQTETLAVGNIHGINFRGAEGQARQVQAVIDELKKHSGPIVFIGDFNTKSLEHLEVVDAVCAQAGLKRISWTGDSKKNMRDQGYVRGITVISAKKNMNIKGSDHPALFFDFQID